MKNVKVQYNMGIFEAEEKVDDICNIRFAVDEAMCKIHGVQCFLSAVTGGRLTDRSQRRGFKLQIHGLLGYTETKSTASEFLFHVLSDSGLKVSQSKSINKTDSIKLRQKLVLMFKDHSKQCISEAIERSNQKWVLIAANDIGVPVHLHDEFQMPCSTSVR